MVAFVLAARKPPVRKSSGEWSIVFTLIFSSISTFPSLNARSSITRAHPKVPKLSDPSFNVVAEEPAPIPLDSGRSVGMERGKAPVGGLWLRAGSEDVEIAALSPDMTS